MDLILQYLNGQSALLPLAAEWVAAEAGGGGGCRGSGVARGCMCRLDGDR